MSEKESASEDREDSIEHAEGDGGPAPASDETIKFLKDELKGIQTSARYTAWRQRMLAEDTRLCRWSGQASDGKKHKDDMNGEAPFPFEGASDGRIRTTDTVINFLVAVIVNAAMKMQWQTSAMEANDIQRAGKMQTVLKYILRNQIGKTLGTAMCDSKLRRAL